ncbi:cell division protein SepF [Neobacillus sp. DY30]|uniref:cell division protein SepF n=1 Tax=Neobacillus sp. DY30 TaxID=3047871 RepID=UPI0024BFC520|nr:cell division protein SepF [Neobacillus sp. DY30]WHY02305.1 cell division protein SepF [Neobacillus sp. DY30]
MTIKSKLKTFFFLDDDYDDNNQDDYEKVEPIKPQKQSTKPQNVVSLQSVQKSSKVILVEPRVYAEAQDITDHLKNRRAVVVNLQRINHEEGRQIVDFLSGAVYAIGGDIQKIGSSIFLCTPDNVEISGNISELVKDQELQDTRW